MYQTKKNSFIPWFIGIAGFIFFIGLFIALSPILQPFIVALILSYILNPLVNKIVSKKIPRSIASLLAMFLAILAFVAVMLIIIPMIITQTSNFIDKVPIMVTWFENHIVPLLNQYFDFSKYLSFDSIKGIIINNSTEIRGLITRTAFYLQSKTGNVFLMIANLFLLPFVLYYFLVIWPQLSKKIQKLVPRRFFKTFSNVARELDEVLGEFLRGQLLVMIIMGFFYGIGLSLVGLENGFAIGFLSGLLVFIPYLGAGIGFILSTVAAVFQFTEWMSIIFVWMIFVCGQLLESYLITPKFVGERIGLSPLMVIFALMAFGQLLGFIGMLLALPLAAVTLVIIRFALKKYYSLDLYLD